MLAAAPPVALTWAALVGAVTCVLIAGWLGIDRQKLSRRLHRAERRAALLETDLSAARREVSILTALVADCEGSDRLVVGSHLAADVAPAPGSSSMRPSADL